RFFPSYYRHVFDTMRRTPIYDADGEETGRTVFDNVVSTRMHGVAEQALHNPVVTPRLPPSSDLTMARAFTRLIEGGYDWRDLQQFFLRVFRYLATSPARRAAELEDVSWWQYLRGYDPRTGRHRYRYSERFAGDVKFSAQVLAAFNAEWGDARTNGSTYAQLFLNSLVPRDTVDGALNGPTSEAWFDPWRRHLEALGVEFVRGRLESLSLDARGRVRPRVSFAPAEASVGAAADADAGAEVDVESDYYVVATDVVTAEQVSRALPDVGVPGQLRGYTTRVAPDPRARASGERPPKERDPCAQPGLAPWDRLQTLSGIQYYFTCDVKLVHGHMYFSRAEWALSSINQQQFWRRPPRLRRDGYGAVLSVDIGAWDRPSRDPALAGRSAWQVSQRELAAEVWRQISVALGERVGADGDEGAEVPAGDTADGDAPDEDTADGDAPDDVVRPRLRLPQPTWFHIDDHIVYDDAGEDATPIRNTAPFLIPVVGDWRRRPGADPWNPARGTGARADGPRDPALWSAPHGGCWIHWSALVYAGTYKRTFTRMTTMESANESARHAVNAILDHYLMSAHAQRRREAALGRRRAADGTRGRVTSPADAPRDPADANTKLWRPAAPDEPGHDQPYRPTLIGDYCQIWNMEEYELPEFESLREHDAQLLEMGLPHPWDLLGVETLPSILSHMPAADRSSFGELRRLLEATWRRAQAGPGATPPPDLRAHLEALQNIRAAVERELEALLRPPAPGQGQGAG
ncbi:MAG: hypothetical protein KC468_31625, partial [Myxococcales bacterium]|nr:hypothetical protein [Myxococcales bacterium]